MIMRFQVEVRTSLGTRLKANLLHHGKEFETILLDPLWKTKIRRHGIVYLIDEIAKKQHTGCIYPNPL
jgi:hypothetical protein